MKVDIIKIINDSDWIDIDQGQLVYERVFELLTKGESVELSFAEHDMMLTVFLNAAVGQLYNGKIDYKLVQEKLSFVDISDDEREKVQRVISNAVRYYENARVYDDIRNEEVDA